MLRLAPLTFSALAAVAALTLAGCGLDGAESTYTYLKGEFAAQIEIAKGPLAEQLKTELAAYEKEYAALPKEEDARLPALEALNDRLRSAKWAAEEKVEAAQAEIAKAAAAEAAALQETFVGIWKGVGMDLTITADGGVAYKKTGGSGNTEVNAPITEFRQESFDVGIMGITTTFKIDAPPHDVDGKTKMTIDGVELTRMDL